MRARHLEHLDKAKQALDETKDAGVAAKNTMYAAFLEGYKILCEQDKKYYHSCWRRDDENAITEIFYILHGTVQQLAKERASEKQLKEASKITSAFFMSTITYNHAVEAYKRAEEAYKHAKEAYERSWWQWQWPWPKHNKVSAA